MYKFPEYIIKNRDFLSALSKTTSKKKLKYLITKADSEQILALLEIIFNVLKGNFVLKNNQRRKLSRNADYYRNIARARTEKSVRHRIQTGGQIGTLAAILTPVIGAIAQHILESRLKKIEN